MSDLRTCVDLKVRAGSKNWLTVRQSGIGASEIAYALGIGNPRWGSPYELYQRKRGALPEVTDNAAMEWGRNLEAAILKRFIKCHPEFRDSKVITGKCYRSIERPWQLATPDAVVFDTRRGFAYDNVQGRTPHGLPVVVQAKTGSNTEGWGQERSDDIPVYYRAQVLQEMDVVGARVAWVPVLFNGREYREYRVEWDERDVNVLRTRGAEFWRRVQEGNPPPVDGSAATRRSLNGIDFEPDAKAQVPRHLVEKIARAKRLEQRLTTFKSGLEAQLLEAMGEAQVAMAGTELAARRTRYPQRRIDSTRLRAEQPEVAEKYTTTTEVSRLNIYAEEFM